MQIGIIICDKISSYLIVAMDIDNDCTKQEKRLDLIETCGDGKIYVNQTLRSKLCVVEKIQVLHIS
jgi:hypothetical protein